MRHEQVHSGMFRRVVGTSESAGGRSTSQDGVRKTVKTRTLRAPIFISYRRGATAAIAGRIEDRLRKHFGRSSVFRDVADISAGAEFHHVLSDALESCNIFIAIIGPDWVRAPVPGTLDYVHAEVHAALKRNVPVVPVLVEKASVPAGGDLPSSIAPIVGRNAIPVDSGLDFDLHMTRLVSRIRQERRRPARTKLLLLGGGAAVALLALLIFRMPSKGTSSSPPPAEANQTILVDRGPQKIAGSPSDGAAKAAVRNVQRATRPLVTRTKGPPRTAPAPTHVATQQQAESDSGSTAAQEHRERARKAYDLGKYDAAIRELEAAYLAKKDTDLLYKLAMSHKAAGHPDKALTLFRSYLRYDPNAVNRAEIETTIADIERSTKK